MLMGELLRRAAAISGGSVAATLGSDRATFSQIDRRANQVARTLSAIGAVLGDRIVSWTDISLGSLDVFFGAARAGAAFAPVNPSFSLEETRDVVDYLHPRILLVDERHLEQGVEIARQVGPILLVTGAAAGPLPGIDLDLAASTADPGPVTGPPPSPRSTHVIFLTSGSTGRPKGVELSHYASWIRSVPTGGATRLQTSGGGGEVCMFPLFHMAGWNSLLCSWSLLRPVHFVAHADGDSLLGEVERWKASTLYCIPGVWERALDSLKRYDVSSLRYALTGTSLATQDLLHEIKDRLPHTETTVSYGSTEMGVVCSLGDRDLFRKPGSIGLPNPGFDVRIVDGELWVHGETAMSGYFELPKETATAFESGWYRSGDLAETDEDGYLKITGRRNEMIRSGGETVAPSEVEGALADYPGVRDLAVIGLPDSAWGEVVCAAVVLQPGAPLPTPADMHEYLAGRLAAFKHPRRVERVAAIPRTAATGQIQRSSLRRALSEAIGAPPG